LRAVVQRVKNASVSVTGRMVGKLANGILVYLGIGLKDGKEDAAYLADKIAGLRIFEDEHGKMNKCAKDMGYGALVVSQFTLYADARKGKRPSFSDAAAPIKANELYLEFLESIKKEIDDVQTGVFQTAMEVSYTNSGPVTILVDSKKEF
jgi:D-tyrosyl-tRNA(Tyr) deacylase